MSLKLGPNYNHNSNLSLREFIYNFLTNYNIKYNTYDSNDNLQCVSDRSRSLGDIHQICLTYYPNVKIKRVKAILLSFGKDLVGHKCGTINKRVYEHKHRKDDWGQYGQQYLDEFGDEIFYLRSRGRL